MATSSKVQFNLKTLKASALESIDQRITRAEQEVASHEDPAALDNLIDDWRKKQEARINELAYRIISEKVSNQELAQFQIHSMPNVSTRDRDRAMWRLRELRDTRSQIVAKADSLVPDDKGNISLTKTQLAEFFGL